MIRDRIVDADCHILEPPDIWKNWLPDRSTRTRRRSSSRTPRAATRGSPRSAATPTRSGSSSTPGMPFDKFRWFGVTYEEARTGCYNGDERLKDMDIDGVYAEILFPPQRTMSHFLGDDDDDFVLAGVEAYNNFLFEEFCAPDPKRLIGMAQIPSLGIDTVDRRAAQGEGARREGRAHLELAVGRRRASRADDDPFWAAAVDEGMPVVDPHQHHQPAAARGAAARPRPQRATRSTT